MAVHRAVCCPVVRGCGITCSTQHVAHLTQCSKRDVAGACGSRQRPQPSTTTGARAAVVQVERHERATSRIQPCAANRAQTAPTRARHDGFVQYLAQLQENGCCWRQCRRWRWC